MAGKSPTPDRMADRGQQLRNLLNQVPGLELTSADRALWKTGGMAAEVELEPDDWIRVRAAAPDGLSPRAALEATSQLEGNVRFARDREGLRVSADTQVDGRSHLPESFRHIARGLLRAATGESGRWRRARSKLDPAAVDAAVDKLGWAAQAVVRMDDQWELRPEFRRSIWPVRLSVEGEFLLARRTVLETVPSGCEGDAVADQALRLNGEIRLARLAQCGERLVVETRLHGGQIASCWLAAAAWSVAVGAWRARSPLTALAAEPAAAQQYVAMFLS